MARYVIFAAEQVYSGLHGMSSTFVTEAASDREIEWIARDASLDIIDSYPCIGDVIRQIFSQSVVDLNASEI